MMVGGGGAVYTLLLSSVVRVLNELFLCRDIRDLLSSRLRDCCTFPLRSRVYCTEGDCLATLGEWDLGLKVEELLARVLPEPPGCFCLAPRLEEALKEIKM